MRERLMMQLIDAIDEEQNSFSASAFAKRNGITAQTVYRALGELEENGKVIKEKNGRLNVYSLAVVTASEEYKTEGLREETVWRKFVQPFFDDLPITPKRCLDYAFGEMMNNAIEHSEGTKIYVDLYRTAASATVIIKDNGVGIFNKISAAMGFEEKSFAILELAKGKFTTMPDSHTGEGVFFSSKVTDEFSILSDGLIFYGNSKSDYPIAQAGDYNISGTAVYLKVKYSRTETPGEVMDRYTQAPDDYDFSKTIVPIRLLEYGTETPLVTSRSQARRLTTRFDRFRNVMLDFDGIDEIGQGFADELFRVFQNAHPEINLFPINCTERITNMIRHVTHK